VLVVGQPVTLRIVIANRMARPAGNVTLQAVVPDDVLVDRHSARLGHSSRDGNVIRWFVPTLPEGEEAELLLYGALGLSRPGGVSLCVTVLSAGAPVEHCVQFQTSVPVGVPDPATATPAPEAFDAAPVEERFEVSRTVIGWALVIVGMIAVGLMLGDRLRRRGAS
jgi:hypothetical protein